MPLCYICPSTIFFHTVSKILFYFSGEEYIEDEPGVLIRSRNSMTRQSITSYKQRSINTILKSQTRSKQYCMFFNKFGKCKKKEDGVCPYIHDPEKVAVCKDFEFAAKIISEIIRKLCLHKPKTLSKYL